MLMRFGWGRFDFTMCNPPFYTSHDEVKELQSQKTNDPFSVSPIYFHLTLRRLQVDGNDTGLYWIVK